MASRHAGGVEHHVGEMDIPIIIESFANGVGGHDLPALLVGSAGDVDLHVETVHCGVQRLEIAAQRVELEHVAIVLAARGAFPLHRKQPGNVGGNRHGTDGAAQVAGVEVPLGGVVGETLQPRSVFRRRGVSGELLALRRRVGVDQQKVHTGSRIVLRIPENAVIDIVKRQRERRRRTGMADGIKAHGIGADLRPSVHCGVGGKTPRHQGRCPSACGDYEDAERHHESQTKTSLHEVPLLPKILTTKKDNCVFSLRDHAVSSVAPPPWLRLRRKLSSTLCPFESFGI